MSQQSNIRTIVAKHLDGQQPRMYLEDIAAHGIHNITNDFHGDSDEEYAAYADEFESQSKALLAAMDEAERR